MQLLITSASHSLAQSLAGLLQDEHEIRLTELTHVDCQHEFVQSALGHDAGTNLLVRGMDAIVHVAEPMPESTENEKIDYVTRCTYNLLWAAAEENIQRFIYLSSLEIMTQYDDRLFVQEHWRPRPTTELGQMTRHLGEYVCREFAREHRIPITVLRLGNVVHADRVTGQTKNPLWIDERDVAQAISNTLASEVEDWSIYHIQSKITNARFPVKKAVEMLDFDPQFNFEGT